jgi:hypothetical protein
MLAFGKRSPTSATLSFKVEKTRGKIMGQESPPSTNCEKHSNRFIIQDFLTYPMEGDVDMQSSAGEGASAKAALRGSDQGLVAI